MPDVAATVTFEGQLGGTIKADLEKVKSELDKLTKKTHLIKVKIDGNSMRSFNASIKNINKSLTETAKNLSIPVTGGGAVTNTTGAKAGGISAAVQSAASNTNEAVNSYIGDVRKYVGDIRKAHETLGRVFSDPKWSKGAGQDLVKLSRQMLLQNAGIAGNQLEKDVKSWENRLKKLTSIPGVKKVAKEAEAYWNDFNKIFQKAESLGILQGGGNTRLPPSVPKVSSEPTPAVVPQVTSQDVAKADGLAKALGSIVLNAKDIKINAGNATMTGVTKSAEEATKSVQKTGEAITQVHQAATAGMNGSNKQQTSGVITGVTKGAEEATKSVQKVGEAIKQVNQVASSGVTGAGKQQTAGVIAGITKSAEETDRVAKAQTNAIGAIQKNRSKQLAEWRKTLQQATRLPNQVPAGTFDGISRLGSVRSLEDSLIQNPLADPAKQKAALGYVRSLRAEMEKFSKSNTGMTTGLEQRYQNVMKMVKGFRTAEKEAQKQAAAQEKAARKELAAQERAAQKAQKAQEKLAQKEAEKAERAQAKSVQATNKSSAKAVADMSKQLGTIRANFNALDHSLVGGKAATGIASEIARVQGMLNKLSGTKVFDEKSLSLLNQTREAFSGLSAAYKQYASSVKSAAKDQKVSETNMQRAAAQAETLRNKMMTFMSNNPRLAGTSYASQINSMLGAIDGGKVKSLDQIKEMKAQYAGIVQTAKEAGKLGPTLGQSIAGAFSKFGGWMLVTHSMMMTIRMFKDMISNVKELDTAMVGLKRVTNLTDQGYQDFFDNAITRSKQVGATLTDTMNATVDFARLGYDVDEASKLADVALVYKNVGVGVEDIDTASSDLISTMKAFGTETKDAQSIVDKFNETGNRFAITSGGVGEAMTRSSAALAAAGNTIDESIGMIVGMNNVLQDPMKVGTTLKTVSMYLRSSKVE